MLSLSTTIRFAKLLCVVCAMFCVVAFVPRARAAAQTTWLVTKAADTNDGTCNADCSLREAIAAANANDTINFAGDYAIVLSAGTLNISKNLTIDATGRSVSVSGNDAVRVFDLAGATFQFTHLTITRGAVKNANTGGGILVHNGATLTLDECTLSSNRAASDGGGIYANDATVHIFNSTFTRNRSGNYGGALAFKGSAADVSGSAFTRNDAYFGGASVYADTGSALTAVNSTFFREKTYNGALFLRVNSQLYNNTIFKSKRSYGGLGIVFIAGNHELRNNIIAGSPNGACVKQSGATFTVNLNTLANDRTCKKNATGYLKASPKLGTFGNYGGATKTLPLLAGSPALDTGDDAACAAAPVNAIDQRGITRPQGVHCDRGAYEAQP